MSEILNKIDGNDYTLQRMVGGSGGEAEDLTIELGAQDTALSTQQTKISELETALENKIALDLANATSDANATASDIAKDKTAYVNGVKVVGAAETSTNNAEIYTNQTATSGFINWQTIRYIVSLPTIDFEGRSSLYGAFSGHYSLEESPLILNTQNVTTVGNMFSDCRNMKKVNLFDTKNVTNMSYMFSQCANLVDIPVFNTSKVTDFQYAFSGCQKLSDDSLNNILQMCIDSNMSHDKSLRYLKLSQDQATTCQSLSNWDAFVAAGWTTGY